VVSVEGSSMSDDESISKPSDAIRYGAENRKVPIEALRGTFQSAKKLVKGDLIEWMYGDRVPFCIGEFNGKEVGVSQFWIGAPAAVAILEEAIACGVDTIFEVGVAGGIQPYLKSSDMIVVTEAIRDEGISFHYLPLEAQVESNTSLRNKLIEHLKVEGVRYSVGPVWSTDGAYRETLRKLRKFRDSGVLAVDMETSAVFAVAHYRGVKAASAQVVSDVLTESKWMLAFGHQTVRESEEVLLKAVLRAISEK